ncbi:MAG: hypothetical protein JKY31_11490, partial [Rhodobacteraceae bacterium]|nr:hypothetical protein [Paracoccaceae bacterium]
MPITFRPARSSEAAEIACFHVEVWRKTYADIVPIEALEKLDVAYRLPVWEQTLTAPKPHQETHVAMRDDKIVGLISFGPASQPA